MKLLSALVALSLSAASAVAAPYVVYSGTATAGTLPASNFTVNLFLVTDLADSSNYAVLHYLSSNNQAVISTYPLASPTAAEANLNFFGSVANSSGAPKLAVLSIGDLTADLSNNTTFFHWYGTGPLSSATTVLAPARVSALTVRTRSSGVVTGTATFAPAAAVSTNGLPLVATLGGSVIDYTISSTGSLTLLTQHGTLNLTLNPVLTVAANQGGAFSPDAQDVGAIGPVNPSGVTTAQAYSSWLSQLAPVLHVTLPQANHNAAVVQAAR